MRQRWGAGLLLVGVLGGAGGAAQGHVRATRHDAGRTSAASTIGGCPLLPADNIWNAPVDKLPVAARSAAYIQSIGADTTLHPDFGSGTYQGAPMGIPFDLVGADQTPASMKFYYAQESDKGPYPIPPDAHIEGGDRSKGDRHVLVVDTAACVLYETWKSYKRSDTAWVAGSGAVFDLRSNALRPDGWTSADAAGLPILPGLVTYDEVASGEITHALRFTISESQAAYVWPARHKASSDTNPDLPPMGQRFRLKASFDISGFAPENQVILRAMKKYGLMVADNGSDWFISGTPDDRWDNDVLNELKTVPGSAFEAVDVSSLQIDPNSGQARPQQ